MQFTPARGAPHRGGSWQDAPRVDAQVLLGEASELIEGTSTWPPAAALAAVSEPLARHLGLTSVVLFKRAAGQSRSLAWSAPNVPAARRLAAREQAWTAAAELLDHGAPLVGSLGAELASVASVAVEDIVLGLSGMMYVESTRVLDSDDRWLVEQVLRMLVGVPTRDARDGRELRHPRAPRRVA
jgi:hypothetical protein